MLSKIPHLLYILSVGAILSGLRGHLCCGNVLTIIQQNVNLLSATTQFKRESIDYLNQEVPDTTPKFAETYDFIVVGAGTAGATIASRLTEIHNIKVLLIEAGPHETLLMDNPLLAIMMQSDENINWHYQTKPSHNYCRGFNNNSCAWPRGRVAGGSSVLNFMIATRGNPHDYDLWAKLGNKGWAYKDVLKYFKKLETTDIPQFKTNTTYRGNNGPVHINFPVYHTQLAEGFMKAGKKLGIPILDYNANNQIGFSYTGHTKGW